MTVPDSVFRLRTEEEPEPSTGRFYGVGLGPGDPGLLTRRAHRILLRADRILCPATGPAGTSRARTVVESLEAHTVDPETYRLDVRASRSVLDRQYERAADTVLEDVRSGLTVAVTTLGDPSLYSTFSRLLARVTDRLDASRIEVVPGLSSPQAAAGLDTRPLAVGDQEVALLPATASDQRVAAVLDRPGAVVLLKCSRRFGAVYRLLEERDLLERAVLVEKAGWSDERKQSLHRVDPDYRPSYFSVVLVYPEQVLP